MALPRHARRIVVDGTAFRWIVKDDTYRFTKVLTVQRESGTGQRLRARFAQYTDAPKAISSGVVADTIRLAMTQGWRPTEPGGDWGAAYVFNRSTRAPAEPDEPDEEPDPLVQLARGYGESKTVDPEWLRKWSEGGREPLQAVWEKTADGGLMLDVLRFNDREEDLRRILQAFAALELRNDARLPPPPGSLEDHLNGLKSAAVRSIREDDSWPFIEAMIWACDVGNAGYGRIGQAITRIIRKAAPMPPTLREYLDGRDAYSAWFRETHLRTE